MESSQYVPKDAETREYHATSSRERCEADLTLIVKRLRDMADKIERDRDEGHYLTAIHEITWGVANLNIDSLARDVAEARAFEAVQAALDGESGQAARDELAKDLVGPLPELAAGGESSD
jgi:hypothetical protein